MKIKYTSWNVKTKLLICNNPDAFVLERVKVFNLPSFIVEPKNFENKETYETYIHQKLIVLTYKHRYLINFLMKSIENP